MICTNPNEQDTDGDHVNDNVEIANHTNPRAASVTASSTGTLSVFTPLE